VIHWDPPLEFSIRESQFEFYSEYFRKEIYLIVGSLRSFDEVLEQSFLHEF
jgi:hypothetical protein